MNELVVTCPGCGKGILLSSKGRQPKTCKSCNARIETQVNQCLAEREEEMVVIAKAVGKGLASAGVQLLAEDLPYIFSKLTRSYLHTVAVSLKGRD